MKKFLNHQVSKWSIAGNKNYLIHIGLWILKWAWSRLPWFSSKDLPGYLLHLEVNKASGTAVETASSSSSISSSSGGGELMGKAEAVRLLGTLLHWLNHSYSMPNLNFKCDLTFFFFFHRWWDCSSRVWGWMHLFNLGIDCTKTGWIFIMAMNNFNSF